MEKKLKKQYRTVYVDHTTGKKYKNATSLGEDLYTCYATITGLARTKGDRFEIYGHDIEVIQTTVWCCSKLIKCLETGEVFRSMSEAAQSLKISPQSLYLVVRNNQTHRGKRYRYLRGQEEIEALCSFKVIDDVQQN